MPILDLQCVFQAEEDIPTGAAQAVADAVAACLELSPGRVWVRIHRLPSNDYAENNETVDRSNLPVFAKVLHAQIPNDTALKNEILTITRAIAEVLHRKMDRVHVEYAPAGAGRIAFGGHLVE